MQVGNFDQLVLIYVIRLLLELISDFMVVPLSECYLLNEMIVFNKETSVLLRGCNNWEVIHKAHGYCIVRFSPSVHCQSHADCCHWHKCQSASLTSCWQLDITVWQFPLKSSWCVHHTCIVFFKSVIVEQRFKMYFKKFLVFHSWYLYCTLIIFVTFARILLFAGTYTQCPVFDVYVTFQRESIVELIWMMSAYPVSIMQHFVAHSIPIINVKALLFSRMRGGEGNFIM